MNTYSLKPKVLDGFVEHLNSWEESIKFTMEIEKNYRISFLYVLVQKRDGGSVKPQCREY